MMMMMIDMARPSSSMMDWPLSLKNVTHWRTEITQWQSVHGSQACHHLKMGALKARRNGPKSAQGLNVARLVTRKNTWFYGFFVCESAARAGRSLCLPMAVDMGLNIRSGQPDPVQFEQGFPNRIYKLRHTCFLKQIGFVEGEQAWEEFALQSLRFSKQRLPCL